MGLSPFRRPKTSSGTSSFDEFAVAVVVDADSANAFFYLWIVSAFVSTCYTYTWDIKMDWGLFDKNAGQNRFLREEIVYPHKVMGRS